MRNILANKDNYVKLHLQFRKTGNINIPQTIGW